MMINQNQKLETAKNMHRALSGCTLGDRARSNTRFCSRLIIFFHDQAMIMGVGHRAAQDRLYFDAA